jgi:hypothetical protein
MGDMGGSVDSCYITGLGDAVATLFSAVASGRSLLGSVNGVLVTLDDILDTTIVSGADGVTEVAQTEVTAEVTVELTFKPESPLDHSEFAAAAVDWVAEGTWPMQANFCGCNSALMLTAATSRYDIEDATSSKKAKKCKGAFTPPKGKTGTRKKGKTGTGKRVTGEAPAPQTGTSSAVIGVGIGSVVIVVALVGIKRWLRQSTAPVSVPLFQDGATVYGTASVDDLNVAPDGIEAGVDAASCAQEDHPPLSTSHQVCVVPTNPLHST